MGGSQSTFRECTVHKDWRPADFTEAVRDAIREENETIATQSEDRVRAGINLLRNYSLQDPARRLTKNTFPGLMTLGDYGSIRIAIQGRVAAGKSHTQNNILKMLGDVASEGVYDGGEGDFRVRDSEFCATPTSGASIVFRNSRGSGERFGGPRAEADLLQAIITNKLHSSDECFAENVRHDDESPLADQCHGVLFVSDLKMVAMMDDTRPGDHTERQFWTPFQTVLNSLDIVPVTIVSHVREGLSPFNLREECSLIPLAQELLGSSASNIFPVENKVPVGDHALREQRLMQELCLALLEVIRQAEMRIYRSELQALRATAVLPEPDMPSKHLVKALLRHTATKHAWPSIRLVDLENRILALWQASGLTEESRYITPSQLATLMSEPDVCAQMFRSDAQRIQVQRELQTLRIQ
eukprot:scpid48770/ scgid11786/ 